MQWSPISFILSSQTALHRYTSKGRSKEKGICLWWCWHHTTSFEKFCTFLPDKTCCFGFSGTSTEIWCQNEAVDDEVILGRNQNRIIETPDGKFLSLLSSLVSLFSPLKWNDDWVYESWSWVSIVEWDHVEYDSMCLIHSWLHILSTQQKNIIIIFIIFIIPSWSNISHIFKESHH